MAFSGIPLLNALTTHRGLPGSLGGGDGIFLAFDVAFVAFACLFGIAAWQLRRRTIVESLRYANLERAGA